MTSLTNSLGWSVLVSLDNGRGGVTVHAAAKRGSRRPLTLFSDTDTDKARQIRRWECAGQGLYTIRHLTAIVHLVAVIRWRILHRS